MSREEFEAWYKEAKEGLELARQGKIDAEEYKSWLKNKEEKIGKIPLSLLDDSVIIGQKGH